MQQLRSKRYGCMLIALISLRHGAELSERKPDQIIAIGDVHGCADELKELLRKLPLS